VEWVRRPVDVEHLMTHLAAALSSRSRPRPRILHVDDDRDTLVLVAHELSAIADVVSADSVERARRVLATARVDLAIVAIQLGTESGLDLLPELRDGTGNVIPVIVFSNSNLKHSVGDKVGTASAEMTTSLECLGSMVRDRLGLPSALPKKEVA